MIRSYAETPLQSNPTWAKPPWTSYGNRVEIQERSEALDTSRLLRIAGFPTLYTDAASGKRLTGCVTVLSRGHELRVVQKESIEWSSTASVLGAEFAAIAETVEYAWKHINDTRLVIMSDSQHALKAIAQGHSPLLFLILVIMAPSGTDHTSFVWLVNDSSSPVVDGPNNPNHSNNLIRSNAAAWGHQTRCRKQRPSGQDHKGRLFCFFVFFF
jgi:ribonuclease HI